MQHKKNQVLIIFYLYSATSLATNGGDQSIPLDELKPFKVRKEVWQLEQ
jgi:hypothetical protein